MPDILQDINYRFVTSMAQSLLNTPDQLTYAGQMAISQIYWGAPLHAGNQLIIVDQTSSVVFSHTATSADVQAGVYIELFPASIRVDDFQITQMDSGYAEVSASWIMANLPSTGSSSGPTQINFSDNDMASGKWDAGLVVDAVAGTTERQVDGVWFKGTGNMGPILGITQLGVAGGINIDCEPDVITGGPLNTANLGVFDTAPEYCNQTNNINLWRFGTSHLGANIAVLAGYDQAGGWWLKGGTQWQVKPDTRITTVAAPTGVTSAISGGTGTLTAGHYRFIVSALNDVGEGIGSTPTVDLVITKGQIISITWNNVSGARGYIVYCAYSASGNPGTALASYTAQYPQTTTTVLKGLLYRDVTGAGTGTSTGYLSVDFESWAVSGAQQDAYIQSTPISVDRSAFYFLRGSNISYYFNQPINDLYNVDGSGNAHFAGHVAVGIGTGGASATVYNSPFHITSLPPYANNTAAVSGGLVAGDLYRTGGDPDVVAVVH